MSVTYDLQRAVRLSLASAIDSHRPAMVELAAAMADACGYDENGLRRILGTARGLDPDTDKAIDDAIRKATQ